MKQEIIKEQTQDDLRFENMEFWRKGFYSEYEGKQCGGCLLLWLTVFGNANIREAATIGNGKIYLHNQIIFDYVWNQDNIPVFSLYYNIDDDEKDYGWIIKNQNFYLNHLKVLAEND